jgi:hypothetical protein
MPKKPWNPNTIAPAFTATLEEAVKPNSTLKPKLLDPDADKVKTAFSDFAQIEVPKGWTIRFYPEEDLTHNIAMAIPASKSGPTVPGRPKKPTFEDCFLGFYDTYLRLDDFRLLDQIFGSQELSV